MSPRHFEPTGAGALLHEAARTGEGELRSGEALLRGSGETLREGAAARRAFLRASCLAFSFHSAFISSRSLRRGSLSATSCVWMKHVPCACSMSSRSWSSSAVTTADALKYSAAQRASNRSLSAFPPPMHSFFGPGVAAPDFVGRTERLQEDLDRVLLRLGYAPRNLTHAHRSRLHAPQPVATTAWLTAQGCPTIVKGALFNHISKRVIGVHT